MLLFQSLILGYLAAGIVALNVKPITQSIVPPPPSQDPWYTAPPGFENAAPGTVFKIRNAPGLASHMTNASAAYNILYRTTDTNYQPSWAVTTLYVPLKNLTKSNKNSPLLSYQLPYDSANIDQSPSWTYYNASVDPGIPFSLGLGWYVNTPDYEGPLASMADAVQEGHATLDSIRAALQAGLGPNNDSAYAMWGYSGGCSASEYAAELQVQYAPEMNIDGMACGGVVPNGTNGVYSVNKGPHAQHFAQSVVGFMTQHAVVREYVLSQLKPSGPYNASTFLSVRNITTAAANTLFLNQDMFQYFQDGEAIFQNQTAIKALDSDAMMGYHGTPQMPIFFYKAIADEFSPIADTDALVQRYCQDGANILYHRNSIGGHVADATNEFPNAVKFLASIFSGQYARAYNATGCTTANVTISTVTSPN